MSYQGPPRYVVRSAPCSYPVVTSALRERLSKPLSEIVYLRTIVRTLGPLEEDIETDMQTCPMSLLDVIDGVPRLSIGLLRPQLDRFTLVPATKIGVRNLCKLEALRYILRLVG